MTSSRTVSMYCPYMHMAVFWDLFTPQTEQITKYGLILKGTLTANWRDGGFVVDGRQKDDAFFLGSARDSRREAIRLQQKVRRREDTPQETNKNSASDLNSSQ